MAQQQRQSDFTDGEVTLTVHQGVSDCVSNFVEPVVVQPSSVLEPRQIGGGVRGTANPIDHTEVFVGIIGWRMEWG